MIELPYTDPDGHQLLLRGIKLRDTVALAETLYDRADDGSGPYNPSHAQRDAYQWARQNDAFPGLPTPDPCTLTWVLVYDGVTVGFVRIGYWFEHAHVLYTAIHPEYQGQGLAKALVLMLMRNIGHLGEKTVSFEVLESAPAIVTMAEKYLQLTPVEQRVGDTKQMVTKYEFVSTDQADRISKDPEQAIPVVIVDPVKPPPEEVPDPKDATPVDQLDPTSKEEQPTQK